MVRSLLCLSMALLGLTPALAQKSHVIDVLLISTEEGVAKPELDIGGVKKIFEQASEELSKTGNEIGDKEKIAVRIDIHSELLDPASEQDLASRIETIPESEPAGTSHTVFCYMKLHGCCDQNGNHYMQTGNAAKKSGDVALVRRNALLNLLKSREAQLTILVTDSCSAGPFKEPEIVTAGIQFPLELFADLFIYSEGVIDLNSSTCDPKTNAFESALMNSEGEGVFSKVFIDLLSAADAQDVGKRLKQIDANSNGRYSWREFIGPLTTETHKGFGKLKALCMKRCDELILEITNPATPARLRRADLQELEDYRPLMAQLDQRPQARPSVRDGLPTTP